MMGRKRDIFIAGIVLLCLWEVSSLLLGSMALPEPWVVLIDVFRKISDGSLLDDLAISSLRALLGIFLALAAAVPLGLVSGAEEPLRRRLSPFIFLLYPIPHVVLLPLIIILFGIGNFSKIFLIALIVFFSDSRYHPGRCQNDPPELLLFPADAGGLAPAGIRTCDFPRLPAEDTDSNANLHRHRRGDPVFC